jgi:hypothetical protein
LTSATEGQVIRVFGRTAPRALWARLKTSGNFANIVVMLHIGSRELPKTGLSVTGVITVRAMVTRKHFGEGVS